MKQKILVVEDRPENLEAAKQCYSPQVGWNAWTKPQGAKQDHPPSDTYDFTYAKDYDEAIASLTRTEYAGIITDCFMPKRTGSGDISLGLSLVERLAPLTPEIEEKRVKFRDVLESYREFLDVDNPEVKKAMYVYGGVDSFVSSIVKSYGKEKGTEFFLKTRGIPTYSGQNDRWGKAGKDHTWVLEQMMQDTEAAQPLGILIIEYAREHGIPHFMLTSRHDQIGGSVIYSWCRDNKIPFDWPTESEKKDPDSGYWIEALEGIERQIQKNATE